jgi:hypothetical protein
MSEPEGAKAPGGERAKQRQLGLGAWLESDSHVACPDPGERLIMRIERTGQTSAARADVT